MIKPQLIIGAGGFGREVFSIIEARRATSHLQPIAGFIDDKPSDLDLDLAHLQVLGSQVLGASDDLVYRIEPFNAIAAVGSALDRVIVVDLVAHSPLAYPPLVNPQPTIGSLAQRQLRLKIIDRASQT